MKIFLGLLKSPSFLFGARKPMRRSTLKLAISTQTVTSSVQPVITG